MSKATELTFHEKFLRHLHASLVVVAESGGPTAGYWTDFMTRVLHRTSNALGLGLCSKHLLAASNDWESATSRDEGLRREYLYDYTMFAGWKGNELPTVLVEHENLYSQPEFFLDFWKLMFGFAPLRVMIGYTRRQQEVEPRWELVHREALARDWVYPATSDDVVLIGHRDMEPTGFKVWVRRAGGNSWAGPTDLQSFGR